MNKMLMKLNIFFLIMILIPVNSYGLCVKVSTANIRSGPGTDYEKVWQVYQHMPVKKVGSSLSGEWYAIRDVDGDVNWIHKSLVTDKYTCAVVKSDSANVRTGPGTIYKKKFSEPATKYESFRIIKRQGAWVKVRDELNNVGWIHKSLLWIN